MRTDFALLVIAITILGGLAIVAGTEPDPCETYREMRAIYQESGGEFGWPRGAIKGCSYGDG